MYQEVAPELSTSDVVNAASSIGNVSEDDCL